MYVQHFGLEHDPFSIAPDPRYLYLGERHREALAHLLYGLGGGGGFVLLTGEVGAGKTTVCRCFLEQVPPNCQVAYVFNPKLTVTELLAAVCEEFGIPAPGVPAGGTATVKTFIDPLNRFLLAAHAAGRNCVLVIDEAQQLAPEVLEQLRLLTNLETNERKLLQIILIGQPELRELLAQPGLAQLAQRVIARYHLGPLDAADTGRYLDHRLAVAGLRGPSPIGPGLVRAIHRLSGGVPRRINLLCDRALLGAYSQGLAAVDRRTLTRAAREVFWQPGEGRSPAAGLWAVRAARASGGLGLVAGVVLAAAAFWTWDRTRPASPGTAAAAAGPASAASASGRRHGEGVVHGSADPAASAARPFPTGLAASAAGPASAASAAPGASSPDLLTLAQWRLRLAGQRFGEDEAWRQLALRWGDSLPPGEACAAAARQRLGCYRTRAGLLQLRSLDRPAVLVLRDGAGPPLHLMLVGVGPQQAWLQVGDERLAMSLADLAVWWQGEFGTFWRLGDDGAERALPRSGFDPALARRLADADGLAPPAPDADDLRSRLARFQTSHGLVPDGRGGPLTDMMLNRAAGVAEPRLAAAP